MGKEMRKDTWSVALACALGAFIGALSALEIAAKLQYGRYLWIFGALLGGMVAWCAVDFKQLCTGVARSYQVSAKNIVHTYHKARGWKPGKLYWKAVGVMMAAYGVLSISLFTLSFSGKFVLGLDVPLNIILSIPFFLFWLAGIMTMLFALFSFHILNGYGEGALLTAIEKNMFVLKNLNPIILPFFLLCAAVDLLRYGPLVEKKITSTSHFLKSFLSEVSKEVGRFFVRSFVYIHSERRTICFVDATLGALIGFFLGSAVIGAAIGAVFGGINYEIVSIRWLKIVPARAK